MFFTESETSSFIALQRPQKSAKCGEPPAPLVSSQKSVTNGNASQTSYVSVTSLRQELVKLQDTVNHFKIQSERQMRELQAEIEEEKYARQALEEELKEIKQIVVTHFGLV